MSTKRLKGKIAIVTGASQGIGRCIAKMFAGEGASVALCARSFEKLEEVKIKIERAGGRALTIRTDMRNRTQVKNMVKKIINEFGSIDILVNNAGLPMFGYAVDDPDPGAEKRYQDIMETNLRGYWYAARFVVPFMKKHNRGSIVNIASVRGYSGSPNDSAYCVAKGGVRLLTRSLAVELAPYNIRVNTISPGAIQVKLGHWVLFRYGEEALKIYQNKYKDFNDLALKLNQPLRITGKPEDVAYAAVYFASNEARFITGADLTVDGGETARLAEPSAFDLEALSKYYQKSKELWEWLASL